MLCRAGRCRTTAASATWTAPGPGPDRHHLGPALRVAHVGERAGQAGDHLAQLALAALVQDDPLVVGADDEPVPGGVPAAVVADRVGLAVDDVDRRAAQPPPRRRGHRLVELVDVPRREGGPAESGGEHALGGAEAELHRPQRAAVGGIDGQRGAQLVAQVGVVGADVAIALGGVPIEVEHAPVVHDQDEPAGPPGQLRADGVLGGLDQGMEGDLRMVEEAGHGPRRGERLRRARQGGQPRHGGVDGVRVLTHELPEPILVAAIHAAEMESILTKITKSQNCVHTYACEGGAGGVEREPSKVARPQIPRMTMNPRPVLPERTWHEVVPGPSCHSPRRPFRTMPSAGTTHTGSLASFAAAIPPLIGP